MLSPIEVLHHSTGQLHRRQFLFGGFAEQLERSESFAVDPLCVEDRSHLTRKPLDFPSALLFQVENGQLQSHQGSVIGNAPSRELQPGGGKKPR